MADIHDLMQAGATERQVDHWTRQGYLRPENNNPGSGRWRVWPDEEVEVVRTMVRLADAGLTVAAAHRVARGEPVLAPGVWVLLMDNDEPASDGQEVA